MSWATVWRRNYTPEELKVRLNTDSHSPVKFRANGVVANMDTYAAAFQCKPGDAMVHSGDKKLVIW